MPGEWGILRLPSAPNSPVVFNRSLTIAVETLRIKMFVRWLGTDVPRCR